MEVTLEFEAENPQEIENDEEVCEEDTQTQAVRNVSRENDQIQENVDVENEKSIEKLNMKLQVDIKSLFTEETKQYIFMEEKRKITKSTLDKQISMVKENIKEIRHKIRNQKDIQQREEVETNNENSKLVEIKIFTQSTKEFVDKLKNYVESLEQQISKLKIADLEKNVLKKYEDSSRMINEKMSLMKQIKTEITKIKSSASDSADNYQNEMNNKISSMLTEIANLKQEVKGIKQDNQNIVKEIAEIDKELEENKRETNGAVELGTILDLQMKNIENFKVMSAKLQELEAERIGLLSNNDYTAALLGNLMEYKDEIVKENSNLNSKLTELQKNNTSFEEYENFDELEIADLELNEENLQRENEELEQLIKSITNEELNLIQQVHEKEKLLFKEENECTKLRGELFKFQNLNESEKKDIEKLKKERENTEKEIQEKLKQLEEAQKHQVSLENTDKQLEISLENHQKELSLKKERLNYEENTLQVHLESKLDGLRKKMVVIEEKKEEEKKRFESIDAANKKKTSEHKTLRNIYLMLRTSNFKSSKRMKVEENQETIEGERTPEGTSPKGILKSPNVKRPTTPTKNVKFEGLSSIASSNDSEVVNTQDKEINDAFDELKTTIIPRKKIFD